MDCQINTDANEHLKNCKELIEEEF